MTTSTSQSTPGVPNGLLTTPIGEIPYFRNLEGQYILVDLFLMISRNWTLRDMFSVNLMSQNSTLRTNPVSTHSEELVNFILERIMLNRPSSNQNIEDAANRIFLEIVPYINIFVSKIYINYYSNQFKMQFKTNFLFVNALAMYCANTYEY